MLKRVTTLERPSKPKRSKRKLISKIIRNETFIAIDTETTGLDLKHGCSPFAVSACDSDGTVYYWEAPVDVLTRKPKWTKQQKEDIYKVISKFKVYVFHNAVFDMQVLCILNKKFRALFELTSSDCLHDTMVLAHLIDSKAPKGLKDQAILNLDVLDDDEEELDKCIKKLHFVAKKHGWNYAKAGNEQFPGARKNFHKMDMWLARAYAESDKFEGTEQYRKQLLTICGKYAKQDAIRTASLFIRQSNTLNEDQNALEAYAIQQRVLFPLIDMEDCGIHLLPQKFAREIEEYTVQAEGFKRSLRKLSGQKDLNPDSGDQLKEVLFDYFGFEPEKLTKTRQPSTDKDSLNKLLFQEDSSFTGRRFVDTLLRYRATNTALKYLQSYSRYQKDSYLHPNMNIVGTSTTRLSSSEPNGQNVSKGKELEELDENGNKIIAYSLRRVFGPPPGYRWYAIDYDQLQIRIFAYLSCEQSLISAIEHGFDFHDTVAKALFGVDTPSKSQRKTAKYINFGIIFGAGQRKIDFLAGISGAYQRFTGLYPNVAEYITRTIEEVRSTGIIRTASGYPLTVPKNKAYAGVNYRVQGTEGDIVKYALANIYEYLRFNEPDIKIILQVHDEFLFQCPDDIEFPVEHICRLMEQAGLRFGVPCKAKPEIILDNWGEAKSIDRQGLAV